MLRAIGILAVALSLLVAALYFAGWINFHKQPHSTTIEIETEEMRKSADDAVEKGKDLIDEARHKSPVQSESGPFDRQSP